MRGAGCRRVGGRLGQGCADLPETCLKMHSAAGRFLPLPGHLWAVKENVAEK